MIRRASWRLVAPLLAILLAAAAGPGAVRAVSATDPDADGLPTSFETSGSHTSPTRADTDGDGLPDGKEDPDRDGLTNRQEYVAKTNPLRADTDGDRTKDGTEDPDRDRLPTWFEFRAGTHPLRADTDRDGVQDWAEDADGDGLSNRREYLAHSDPRLVDTDADGWSDATEVYRGTNPRDPSHFPGSGGSAPTLPEAAACPIFPASNVWNQRVDGLAVRTDSATLIATIGSTTKLHPDFGSYVGYGIPYNVVGSDQSKVSVAFDYDDDSDHVPYPIPAAPKIEAGSDRHILIVDRDACRLYELFAARKSTSGAWSAGSGATWDLASNALRPAGWTSADAAGLPILAGLVRYDEVAAGEIRHAIRFTTDETRRAYIYPARHFASSLTGAQYPPMGLRVRLKAGYDVSGLPYQARIIAIAMQRYGLILADNGSPWYFQGASDTRWDDDQLDALKAIPGSAFEAVDTSDLVNGP